MNYINCKGENIMDKDKIVDAFDKFVDERFADSEDTIRTEIKQAVNDHLKDKLELEKDPIVDTPEEELEVDDDGSDAGDDE